jgi:hypothetical protein
VSVGPLRRIAASIGLVALAPIAVMLVSGALSPEAAALRATVVGLVAVALGNLARVVLGGVLRQVEGAAGLDPEAPDDGGRAQEALRVGG